MDGFVAFVKSSPPTAGFDAMLMLGEIEAPPAGSAARKASS